MTKDSPEYLNCLKENNLKEVEVKVRPLKKGIYGGTDTVWEYLLSINGWNDLPEEKKFGIIPDYCQKPDGDSFFESYGVSFPHCNNVSYAMFVDEFDVIIE